MLTVLTTASGYDLTTLEVVKEELELENAESDSWLLRQIAVQSKRAAAYLGRTLAREIVQETLKVRERQKLILLRRWPLVEVTGLTINGDALVEGTDYCVDSEFGSLEKLGSWNAHWPTGTAIVSYSAGYLLPDDPECNLPEQIQDAVVKLVVGAYATRGRDPTLRSEEARDLGSQEFRASAMPQEVKEMLNPFRSVEA